MRIVVLLCLLCAIYPATYAQEAQSPPTPAPQATPAATPTPTPAVTPTPPATQSTPTPTPDATPQAKAYLIQIGDTLDVTVARRPELSWRGHVTGDGEIPALPYLKNPVRALCRTEQEIAAEIAKAYEE